MKEEITVPSFGESVTTAIISSWVKNEGDYITEGEDLYELESDKASMAVPAPVSGVLSIQAEEETEVEVGQVVATVDTEASPPEAPPPEASAKETPPEEKTSSEKAPTSPAVRRAVAEYGLDTDEITGTGEKGRVLMEDVERARKQREGEQRHHDRQQQDQLPEKGSRDRGQTREKMSRIRQKIASNLVQSKQHAAHLTTFNEISMDRIMEIRRKYKEQFQEKHGLTLGFMSFFIKACCAALKKYPVANSFIEGDEIVYNNFYNIGIAVSTERGLVVPVIKEADTFSVDELERQVAALAAKAREKKISIEEMTGGTFSITNGGVFGSLLSTPIPTPPQSAVLGMHTIQERPVVVNGEIVAKPMMYVALTYDHRVMDGREAIGFLITVKELIEEPEKMLLNL